jgi:hypothetical protein
MNTAALVAFPELRKLVDLRERCWTFFLHTRHGELVQINGLRAWPGGYADAIRVRNTTDVSALRCDHTGGALWHTDHGSGIRTSLNNPDASSSAIPQPTTIRSLTASEQTGAPFCA